MRQKPQLPRPFDRPRSIAFLAVAAAVAVGIGWQRADAQPGPRQRGATPAAGPSAQVPTARTPAAGPAAALPLTPKDAKTIQLLERFAADEKRGTAGRIEQIAKTGLGPAVKNPAVRAAARRLLAGIAAESPEGALAMIEEAQAGLSKGVTPRLGDTLVVALRIVPETDDDRPPDPAMTAAFAALVKETDAKASDSQKMYALLADVARGVGREGALDGDPAPAVQALDAIVAMKVFENGTEKDPRVLGLMEGVIDGLAVSLRAPKAFDLLLNKVWPKLDKEPRLEKDWGAPVIQRSLEKVLAAVHAQTGRTEGMWHKEWQSWWSTVDEADREEALAHPLGQRLPAEMADGQVVLDAGAPSDGYKPGGESYVPGTTPAGEPESVVFVLEGSLITFLNADENPVVRRACADMIRRLPNGAKFNVILCMERHKMVNDVLPNRWSSHAILWKPELVTATPASIGEGVEWTLNHKRGGPGDTIGWDYYGLADALALRPDRVISFWDGDCVGARGNSAEKPEGARGELRRYDVIPGRWVHFNQIIFWNRRLVEAALNPLVLAGPGRDGRRPTAMCTEMPKWGSHPDIPGAERWARLTGGYVNIWPHGID